jgi:predicted ATP-binding protein involved in virulence
MNERIRQLAEQAREYATTRHPVSNITLSVNSDLFEQKFAELLIRQCCLALNPMLRDMISRGQGVELIKLHFGMNPKEITTAMLDASIAQCEQELAKKKSGVE